jgi:hypothetical protein
MTDEVLAPVEPQNVAITLYDADGNITATQMLLETGLPAVVVPTGQAMYTGAALDHLAWYFQAGQPVAYTQAQSDAKRARPAYECRWDNAAMAWIDVRTLDEAKADQWAAIKAAREAAEYGGFAWDGSMFDSDANSQSRIQGGVQLANTVGSTFSIDWTLADNTVRTLSAADMVNVGLALGQHVETQFSKARTLRAQIEAATTAAEVVAVNW